MKTDREVDVRILILFFVVFLIPYGVTAQENESPYGRKEELIKGYVKPKADEAKAKVEALKNQRPSLNEDDYVHGVDPVTLAKNHIDDYSYIYGTLPFLNPNFLQCSNYTLKRGCLCMALVFTSTGTELRIKQVKKYRWPVQKVESGIPEPFYSGYLLSQEVDGVQIPFYKFLLDSGALKSNVALRLQKYFPGVEIDKILEAVEVAVKAEQNRPDHEKLRGGGLNLGGARLNEYRAMAEPFREAMRIVLESLGEVFLAYANVDFSGIDIHPMTCHEEVPIDPLLSRWYSDTIFDGGELGGFWDSRFPDLIKASPAFEKFREGSVALETNPLLCSGLYKISSHDEGLKKEALSPADLIGDGIPKKDKVASKGQISPCLSWNHGPLYPFTPIAYTNNTPTAAAVGFNKGLRLGFARRPDYFYEYDPSRDQAQFKGEDLPSQCMDVEQNYMSGIFGKAMENKPHSHGNLIVHWKEFECCGLEDVGIFLGYFPPGCADPRRR